MEQRKKITSRLNSAIQRTCIYLFLMILFSSCAFQVKLVGKYDEVLDESIRELHTETSSFFISLKKDLNNSSPDYGDYESFYEDINGKLSFLILRSEILEKDAKANTLTNLLNDLSLQYNDMEELHQNNMIGSQVLESTKKAFERSFRSITVYMVNLRENNKLSE